MPSPALAVVAMFLQREGISKALVGPLSKGASPHSESLQDALNSRNQASAWDTCRGQKPSGHMNTARGPHSRVSEKGGLERER